MKWKVWTKKKGDPPPDTANRPTYVGTDQRRHFYDEDDQHEVEAETREEALAIMRGRINDDYEAYAAIADYP